MSDLVTFHQCVIRPHWYPIHRAALDAEENIPTHALGAFWGVKTWAGPKSFKSKFGTQGVSQKQLWIGGCTSKTTMNRRVFQKNNYFVWVNLGNTVFLEGTRFSVSKKSKSLNNRISLQPNSCHIRPHQSKGNDTIAVGYNLPINCLCAAKSTTKQLQMGCTFAKLPGMPRLSSECVFYQNPWDFQFGTNQSTQSPRWDD